MKLIRLIHLFCIPLILFSTIFTTATASDIKTAQKFGDIKMMSTNLYAANGNIADGNLVVFDNIYSNEVDRYDARKMTNPGENFGLKRDGYTLAIEARQPIATGDTIYYQMANLVAQTYTVKIEVQFLQNTLQQAEWVDRFTNARRIIDLTQNSTFTVNVTADPASKAPNRFYIVFKAAGATLPVKFTGINLQLLKKSSTQINWTVASEENIINYSVEKSWDGRNFENIASISAQLNNDKAAQYSYQDLAAGSGNTFYRIAANDQDGKKTYSPIKMINVDAAGEIFTVVNPVQQKQLQLFLNEIKPGKIVVSIYKVKGNLVQQNELQITNRTQTLMLPVNNLQPGRYLVNIQNEQGRKGTKIIIIQ